VGLFSDGGFRLSRRALVKEFIKEAYWLVVELTALMFFIMFASTMIIVFGITDIFRKEKK